MGKVRFELDKAGVRELLKSPEMAKVVNDYASDTFRRLSGAGYEQRSGQTSQRVYAAVAAVEYEARKENAESNTLLKALG